MITSIDSAPRDLEPHITLTLKQTDEGVCVDTVRVKTYHMLSYIERGGITCLRLTGGRELEVRETSGQIDLLVRRANASPVHGT
jgi:hypothetical protein